MKKNIIISIPSDVYEKANELARMGGNSCLEERLAMTAHYFAFLYDLADSGNTIDLEAAWKNATIAKQLGMSFRDTFKYLQAICQQKQQPSSET